MTQTGRATCDVGSHCSGGISAGWSIPLVLLLAIQAGCTGAVAVVPSLSEQTVRLECVADTAVYHHKSPNRSRAYEVNYGAADVLPFHGIHYTKEANDSAYYLLADFDSSPARRLKVSRGTLMLRLLSLPDAGRLRVVSVSTVATPWNEGRGKGAIPEKKGGGATANWAVSGERRWAGLQSELIDATFGLGGSIYHTTEVRHLKDGWVAVEIPDRIAQAVIDRSSCGLALFEEKGQTNISYKVHSRESSDAPYLVVRGIEEGPDATGQPLPVNAADPGSGADRRPGGVRPVPVPIDTKRLPAGDPPARDGRMRVWAHADCEAAHPVSGNLLEEAGAGQYGGSPAGKYRKGNAVWNGRENTVSLAACRNEIVSFQLVVEALRPPLKDVLVRAGALNGPGRAAIPSRNVQTHRLWYVHDRDWKPEICLPAGDAGFDIPDPANKVDSQRHQAVIVDVWVPRDASAGTYRGTVSISTAGVRAFDVPVVLEVWPFALPDTLSFNCELNSYSGSTLTEDHSWFRLAHAHRATLNVLPYSQDGTLKPQYAVPLTGQGASLRVADWAKYDAYFAPLFDGSAFRNMRGAGVPLKSQYLPFNEAWPVPFRKHYSFTSTDLQEHFLTAGPIETLMDESYAPAFEAVVRDYLEHFRRKGWTRTAMQFYLNNKPNYTKGKLGFWCLDEPQHRDDFLAIAYWARLFRRATAVPAGSPFIFRADISRPHLQRDWLDGLVDLECASSVFFAKSERCREMMSRGSRFYNYGSLNPVKDSNLNAEAWPVSVWLLGGDGLVPWNTIGDPGNYLQASSTAILLPAPGGNMKDAPVVCSVRLKALRRGQQDVEYLALLSTTRGYSRDDIAGMLSDLLNLEGATSERFLDEAGETVFPELSSRKFAQMRAAVARLIAGR